MLCRKSSKYVSQTRLAGARLAGEPQYRGTSRTVPRVIECSIWGLPVYYRPGVGGCLRSPRGGPCLPYVAYDLEPRTLTPRCQHSGSPDFNTGTSQRPPSRESMNEQSTGKTPPPAVRHPPSVLTAEAMDRGAGLGAAGCQSSFEREHQARVAETSGSMAERAQVATRALGPRILWRH